MKIERLILENFRGVGKTLELPLKPDVTVLAGVNGSGKSTILDALAILLSWIVARTRRAGGSGQQISELSIHNSAGYARIRAEATDKLHWQLVKTRKGYAQPACSTELEALSKYTKSIQQLISETQGKCNIPVFAYYPVNRAVLDIPLRIRQSHDFSLLDAWDEALVGAANFRHFFEWFRNRQDLENEKISEALVAWFFEGESTDVFNAFIKKSGSFQSPKDIQLNAIRIALSVFLPDFRDITVHRKPLRMVVNKKKTEIRIDQLSDGEKCLIALVSDLARRLAMANPELKNPLAGEGIVLIDEIDLHIHPGWQRTILANLRKTFPNCQFIVSTHSPQVLGEAEGRQIRVLTQDEENGLSFFIPKQARGLSSNEILDEIMRPDGGTLTRNNEVQQKLDNLFRLIDREQFEEAKKMIAEMKQELNGDIPELVHADSLMFMLEDNGQ